MLFNWQSGDKSSTVEMSFYLSNSNFANPDDYLKKIDIQDQVKIQDVNRFITFAYSNELKNHLIEKFNLLDNYKLDLIDFDNISDYHSVLEKKYAIYSDKNNGLKLIVYDENKDFAIRIGKEIVYKSYEYSKRFIEEGKIKQLQISDKQINYYKQLLQVRFDSISRLKNKINILGWSENAIEYIEEDISNINYLYGNYSYKILSKQKDSSFQSVKRDLNILKAKYKLRRIKDLEIADLINEIRLKIEFFEEEMLFYKNTIESYLSIKRNINLSKEFIKLDQPTITSISTPKNKVTSKFYYILISLLIALYTGVLYLFVIFYYRRIKEVVRSVKV